MEYVCSMCLNPIWLPNKSGSGQLKIGIVGAVGRYVPCGHCVDCLRHRQNLWFLRFWCETKYQKRVNPKSVTLFLTFTYNEENLPSNYRTCLNDWRSLVKKVQRHYPSAPCRYYAVTEQGSLKGRLHFHALFFGIDLSLYEELPSKVFEKFWSKGFISCRIATNKDFRYVCKYITKDLNVFDNNGFGLFQTCSKKPALGVLYFSSQHRDVFNNFLDNQFLYIDGFRYSLPRYYRDLLLTDFNKFLSSTRSGISEGATLDSREKDRKEKQTIKNIYGFKKRKNIKERECLS